jgi:hypothetical protein
MKFAVEHVGLPAVVLFALASASTYAAGGGGGGGGGAKMQIATSNGINVIENPSPGEVSMTGFVEAALAGSGLTPSDTVVTLNGVPLVHAPGLAPAWFQVDPAGPQPTVGADGFLHIVASSQSARSTRTLNLPCPAHIDVTTVPTEGSSLSGVSTLSLSWSTPLPQNSAAVLNFFEPPSAVLSSYDLTTGAVTGGISFASFSQLAMGADLSVLPSNSSGYRVAFTYPGIYVLDGNSGGVCAIQERFVFSAQ